jgi:hypothetical protein
MRRLPVLLVLVFVLASTADGRAAAPVVAFLPGTPADYQAVALATWGRFVEGFPGRATCIAPVRVAGAWELGDRADYDPAVRLVTARLPGTAPNLTASLLHEFAHHLDFTCPELGPLRVAFLAAQGFPPGASWSEGATWETTPAEQFAEGVVEYVLGRPPAHPRVSVSAEAIDAIRAWGRGS